MNFGGVMKKLLAVLFFPLFAHAQPGPAIEYLTHEPATLFDVGMMRLDALTAQFQQRVGLSWLGNDGRREFFKAEVNSEYDSSHNKIYVSFLVMNSDANNAQMEEGCRVATEQMSFWLGKSLPALFAHVAAHGTTDANRLVVGLQDIVELRCYVSSQHSTGEGRFWASRTLKDNALKIGRWD